MISPTQRAEQVVDAALDIALDALLDDDEATAETAMTRALRAAWLVKQREWQALDGLDDNSPSAA